MKQITATLTADKDLPESTANAIATMIRLASEPLARGDFTVAMKLPNRVGIWRKDSMSYDVEVVRLRSSGELHVIFSEGNTWSVRALPPYLRGGWSYKESND